MNGFRWSRLVALFPAAVFAVACGDTDEKQPPPNVEPAAEISSLRADPEVVAKAGDPATISWKTKHAVSLELRRNGEVVELGDAPVAEGSVAVEIDEPSTFVLVAHGASGDPASREVTVDVAKPDEVRILTFQANPAEIREGESTVISWTTTGATSVSLTQDGEAVDLEGETAEAGSVEVTPASTAEFVLVATGEGGSDSKTLQVVVNPLPPEPTIASFTAPAFATIDEDGGATITVEWAGVEHADSARLEVTGLDPIEIDELPDGSVELRLEEDADLILIATGEGGEAQAEQHVTLVPLPAIESLVAVPARAGAGEPVEIRWATVDAAAVELDLNGVPVEEFPTEEVNGSISLSVMFDSEFELRAYNAAGDFVSESLQVILGTPEILAFSAASDSLWLGEDLVLSWSVLGGSSLEIRLDGEVVCESTDPEVIAGSSCSIPVMTAGLHSVEFTVTNGSGSAQDSLAIAVGTGPVIADFTVSPARADADSPVTVTWQVLPDPDGSEPTLALTDDQGGSYDLPDGSSGTTTLTFTEPGTFELTLTATTDHPSSLPAEESREVQIFGVPEVMLTASTLLFDDSVEDEVILSWTSSHAATLVLYEVPDDGSDPIVILSVPADERESGSFAVVPTQKTRYRLVATNGNGTARPSEEVVDVAPTAILSFDVQPTEIVAGEPVTLTWSTRSAQEVSFDFIGTYIREETHEPFIDAEALGGTKLPLVSSDCSGSPLSTGCEVLNFPQGFTFPFGGADRTEARIYSNGIVSFTTSHTTSSSTLNSNFPTSSTYSYAHIVPFWDSMGWDEDRFPTGNIWYLHREDPVAGDSLVIMWKGIGFSAHRTANLNFEVILWENGDFEYRYGAMEPATATAAWVTGSSASIGYQFPDQSSYDTINYNTTTKVRDRLEGKAFAYRVAPASLPKAGTFEWRPYTTVDSIDVTLTATGASGQVTETRTIDVVRKPIVDVVQTPPLTIEENETFRIAWETMYADAVSIEDGDGNVLCTASPHAIESGFCDLSEATEGTHTYVVRADGAGGYSATRSYEVQVYAPFGIEEFEADPLEVELGQTTTLTWQTFGDVTVSLTANGTELLNPGEGQGTGSYVASGLTADTTFVLRVTNPLGLTREESLTIELWKVSLTASATPPTAVRPGTPVQIDVTGTSLDSPTPPVIYGTFPMTEETDPSFAFQDISGMSGVGLLSMSNQDSGFSDVVLPAGFTFPYFGEEQEEMRVFVDGYVSFTKVTNVYQNVALPSALSAQIQGVHLAPFWDDLHQRGVGQVYAGLIAPDTFAIQWTGVSLFSGSTTSDPSNLNFQLLMKSDGSFEYRYGTMAPQNNTSSACHPNTCVNEVRGASATIGYQDVTGRAGVTVHYGGTTNAAANVPFPGGLEGRTFRYQPVTGTGTFTLTPTESQTLVFCATSGASKVCKDLEVLAPFEIESFTATSDLVAPGESFTLSWVTKGGTNLVLKENGTAIQTVTDLNDIDGASLLVTPPYRSTYTLELTAPGRSASAVIEVDMDRFDITATGPAGVSMPGAPAAVSWTLTNFDPNLTPVVIAPMAEATDRTLAEVDISLDPDVEVLHDAGAGSAMTVLTFDPDFAFPFMGKERTEVRVSTDGYLSFEPAATTSTGSNQRIPNTTAAYKRVHIAPFWDDLNTRTNGRVLAKRVDADTYVVQWSHVSLDQGSTASNEFDLNFAVVLRRDGSFDFRYGDMLAVPGGSSTCQPNTCVSEVNGSSATIGYQEPEGLYGHMVHFGGNGRSLTQPWVAPTLSHRSWVFQAASGSGTAMVTPTETTEYRICALEPETGKVECAEPVEVKVDWGILDFTATPESAAPGDPVTLSWTVAGVDSFLLEADGTTLESYPAGAIPTSGSVNHNLTSTTAYTLTVTSLGRTMTVTRVVEKRTFHFDVQGPPAGRYFPGTTVPVTWTGAPIEAGQMMITSPMSEVDASPGQPSAYQDISLIPGATEVTMDAPNGKAYVTLPFDFPYFGEIQTEIGIWADGYASFVPSTATSVGSNTALPNSASSQSRIQMAVFWDDLFMRGNDTVWSWQPSPDEFVIQWKNFNRSTGSSATSLYDLNFQLALFSDGSFEYRYGPMRAPPQPFSHSSCYPSTCELEASYGSSATIGYQNVGGTMGYQMHFGGNTAAEVVPFAGGLEGRSFRFDASMNGQAQVQVGGTARTHRICATLNGFTECKDVEIRPVAEPGDLLITELMINPAGGAASQWFEVRNLSDDAIDLDGFVIESNAGSHAITGPLVVPSRGFVTFAASAAGVGFVPDHEWGASLSLDTMVDRLVLRAGASEITAVEWGGTWFIPADATLSLDPSWHVPSSAVDGTFERWCAGTSAGTPGALAEGCRYDWMDVDPSSTAPFHDISATGKRLVTLEADSGIDMVPVRGFSMPIKGEIVGSTIWASSNGWISFSAVKPSSGTSSPTSLPRSGTANPAGPLVAVFMDDLKCDRATGQACTVHYELRTVGTDDVLIVQWTNFTRGSTAGSLTVQAQLWPTGEVIVAFGDVHSEGAEPGTTAFKYYRGSSAWIGIEPSDRTAHVDGLHRTELPLAGRSFRFTPR
ncbi:MAG TPA: hypothetical protein VN033_01325 [Vulgatibacter sp.]|nr:hypothetical protein [Vulgatibacter sp.]